VAGSSLDLNRRLHSPHQPAGGDAHTLSLSLSLSLSLTHTHTLTLTLSLSLSFSFTWPWYLTLDNLTLPWGTDIHLVPGKTLCQLALAPLAYVPICTSS
jgi:hypothetical protein